MHRGLDDPHDHAGHHHSHDGNALPHARPGHNSAPTAVQWQTPHLPPGQLQETEPVHEPDFDLVEASFVEGFAACSDPTSFLRLAGVPFAGRDAQGRLLHLLRVEIEDVTDVGSAAPLLGGAGMRYAPLPGRLASRRRRLAFAYHDGSQVVRLAFAEARRLAACSGAHEIPA